MGKKTTGALTILVIVLLALNIFQFYYFRYMEPSVPAEDVPMPISDLKGPGYQGFIGKRVTVEGFFVLIKQNLLMLVSNLDYLARNELMSNDKFVRVLGNTSQELLEHSGSAMVHIKGLVHKLTWGRRRRTCEFTIYIA